MYAKADAAFDRLDVAAVAHDWMTLLAIIDRCANAIRESKPDNHAIDEDLIEFRRAGERMNSIAQQLISHRQIETNGAQVLDLSRLVAESQGMLTRALATGISVRLQLAGDGGVHVRARRWHLERILLNLVLNASRGLPAGGIVVVATSAVQPPLRGVTPTHIHARRWVTLSVSASSSLSETSARVVPHFSASQQDGRDVGLTAVARLVEQIQGVLQFESDSKHHTWIRVDFPVATDVQDVVD